MCLTRETLSELEYKVVGSDALVAIVHLSNPVDNISPAETSRLYRRWEIYSWQSLNPEYPDWEIPVLRRNPDSGTSILLQELVLGEKPDYHGPSSNVVYHMSDLFPELRRNPHGLGFSTWYYERNIRPAAYCKVLAIDGIHPSLETIADGTYPWRASIYAAIRKDEPPDSPARQLYDFLSTPEGQALIRAAGYVPLVDMKPRENHSVGAGTVSGLPAA